MANSKQFQLLGGSECQGCASKGLPPYLAEASLSEDTLNCPLRKETHHRLDMVVRIAILDSHDSHPMCRSRTFCISSAAISIQHCP